jgi:hypothetical protein
VLIGCLVYALLSKLLHSDKIRYRILWLRFCVIIMFYFVAIMSFLKPYIHMDSGFNLETKRENLVTKFHGLDAATPAIGLSFGVLAYNLCIPQMNTVTELMQQAAADVTNKSPSKQHFKLPLIAASFCSFVLKCTLGIIGGMLTPADFRGSNVFGNLLFSEELQETVLVGMAAVTIFIIVPDSIDQQK